MTEEKISATPTPPQETVMTDQRAERIELPGGWYFGRVYEWPTDHFALFRPDGTKQTHGFTGDDARAFAAVIARPEPQAAPGQVTEEAKAFSEWARREESAGRVLKDSAAEGWMARAALSRAPAQAPAVPEELRRRVYLAARYSRHREMQGYRAELERLGYTVTSRWINGGHELTKEGSTEAHAAERTRYAQEDMADLLSADICISFTEVPRETTTRGGRHVEHGMALALGKRTIVVGWRENVFHCLPQVEFFERWADALRLLANAAKNREGGEHE